MQHFPYFTDLIPNEIFFFPVLKHSKMYKI